MRKPLVFLALCASACGITAQDIPEQSATLNSTSHSILHVFYTTQHLAPIVAFIKKTCERSERSEKQCTQQIGVFFTGTALLKSLQGKMMVCSLEQSSSIQPLLVLWQKVKHFKYGINEVEKTVLLDFSKVCLVAYQSLLSSADNKYPYDLLTVSPEDLDHLEIDEVFETLEKCAVLYFLRRTPFATLAAQAISSTQGSLNEFCASFALRYYLNKRLHATFELFNSLQKHSSQVFAQGVESLGFNKTDLLFDHPVIAGYFSLLLEEKRLDPLVQLIEQFQSFAFIKSHLFVKEFLILLCVVYKDIFPMRSTEAIEELHKLSVEQILTLIDRVHAQYHRTTEGSHGTPSLTSSIQETHWQEISSITDILTTEYKTSPQVFTSMVFHRYYYVKRLEEVAKLLLKLDESYHHAHTLLSFRTSLFLKPLSLVWDDFKAYRDITNQKLINDLTKEIFILSQTLLHAASGQSHFSLLHHLLSSHKTSSLHQGLSIEQNALFTDFKPWIEIDKVIERFYLLHRLEPILQKLQALDKHKMLAFEETFTRSEESCLESLKITCEPIARMIHRSYCNHSLHPLFAFWNGLNRYKYIQDDRIMNEFARFTTYVIHATAAHQKTLPPILSKEQKNLALSQLHDMPLEDILNFLDILVEELPEFLEKNEIHAGMDWKQWLKKYWLIGPISIAVFGIRVYMMSQGILERPQHHPGTETALPVEPGPSV